MENLLLEYLERAFVDRGSEKSTAQGPVVTISREYGCPSKLIAQLLANGLNAAEGHDRQKKWRVINKEIVEEAAKKFELHPSYINNLLNAGGKGVVNDILSSFSSTYVSDHRIRKIISTVVSSIAGQGFVVIVGRGSVGVLRHFPNSVHFRLQAPLEWRVDAVCRSTILMRPEATRIVEEMDKKRTTLIELMTGGKYSPYLFDAIFNCSTLSNEEVAGTMVGLLKTKKLI